MSKCDFYHFFIEVNTIQYCYKQHNWKVKYMADKKIVKPDHDQVVDHEKSVNEDVHKLDLRGTFFMTMTLGALMLISWLGVFMLFMERM